MDQRNAQKDGNAQKGSNKRQGMDHLSRAPGQQMS